jgi:intermediate peptidase
LAPRVPVAPPGLTARPFSTSARVPSLVVDTAKNGDEASLPSSAAASWPSVAKDSSSSTSSTPSSTPPSTPPSTPSPSTPSSPPPPASLSPPPQDDALLRELFDFPSPDSAPTGPPTGLFKNEYLHRPEGFLAFAQRTIEKAERIVDKVLWASTDGEYREVVRDLDRLSDLLCRVLDLSDFVRMTHPDARFQQASSAAWGLVYQYMNRLNTMTGLSDQLRKALASPAVTASWTEEERAVADILQLDFEKSAIHLPPQQRDRFVWLSQRISEVGTSFCAEMEPATPYIDGPSADFFGLHPRIAADLTVKKDRIRMPALGMEASAALRSVHAERVRQRVYVASRTASRASVARLEEMLALRSELAQLAGFKSYAHMALKDRMMARDPGSVADFLTALHSHNQPVARAEMDTLRDRKRAHLQDADAVLRPWDRDYYMDRVRGEMRDAGGHHSDDDLAAYFSLGTVMQGISRLFSRLYGIRFVPRASQPGETWHRDVRRLDVVADSGALVAVLYCDLFARPNKSPNPTHFTVRCSREIAASELDDAALEMAGRDSSLPASHLPRYASPHEAANDGMETAFEGGVLKQLPTIALVCDFAPRASSSSSDSAPSKSSLFFGLGGGGGGSPSAAASRQPPLLTLRQVETLFHEMGHAAHSILARTSLQNVSGTRCATDMAELPSTLMEHFATDPAVLSLFARHWKTNEPLPFRHIAERVRLSSRFDGIQTEYQILLALVDQAYHTTPPPRNPAAHQTSAVNSTNIYRHIQETYATPPGECPSTRWQGFFGHLHGYGSTYYSYIFDRVLAERVWKVVFRGGRDGGAVDRANGERLKESLLKWGGGRDPWVCLAAALGDDRLASGDRDAMAIVGSWGIKHGLEEK